MNEDTCAVCGESGTFCACRRLEQVRAGIWTTQGVLWTGESNVGQQPIPIERILAHAPVPMPREVKP